MVVGSEGTLAVVTEAKVRLRAACRRCKGLAAVHFRSVVEAAEATVAALEHAPSAVELVDDVIVQPLPGQPELPARWPSSSSATRAASC